MGRTELRPGFSRKRASIPGSGENFFNSPKCPPSLQWALGMLALVAKWLVSKEDE